jgi:hypothetical protein
MTRKASICRAKKKKNLSTSTKIMYKAQIFAGFPVFLLAHDALFVLSGFNPSLNLKYPLSLKDTHLFTEQLGSHESDFLETRHLNNFAKRYVKSKFPLKSDKNNEYFA